MSRCYLSIYIMLTTYLILHFYGILHCTYFLKLYFDEPGLTEKPWTRIYKKKRPIF